MSIRSIVSIAGNLLYLVKLAIVDIRLIKWSKWHV